VAKPRIILDSLEEMLNIEPVQELAAPPVNGAVMEMDFGLMEFFPEHKFKLYTGKQFEDMRDSIQQFGILLPIILWHTDEGRFIILSGHNRKNCGEAAGLNKGPVIIKENLTYEDAVLIVIETNLRQRSFSDMSHSERAYCLFEHYKAMKSQGKRNDLILEIERLMNTHNCEDFETSAKTSRGSGSRAELAEQYSLTEDKVAKYVRVGEFLQPALIELLDENRFPISVANTLSFILDQKKQQAIADLMINDNYKLDGNKADLLRTYHERGKLTDSDIMQILSGEKERKPKNNKPQPVKIKPAVVSKYFTRSQTKKEIEEIIDKALEFYFNHRETEGEPIG